MRQTKIDIGIVGVGNTGSEHLNFYKNYPQVNKIFVSESKKLNTYTKKIVDDINLKKFKKSIYTKLLSISNYDKDHSKLITKNYKNSHIFVEKPMCTRLIDLNRIYKIVKKNNFKNLLFSNLVLRNSKIFNKILKKIKKGDLGKIYYFEGDYLYGRLKKLTHGWRGKDKNYSVTLGGGIHMIDLMINFIGELPLSVFSQNNKIVSKKNEFKFNDFSQNIFNFKNGSIGKITSNFGCVHHHQHVVKIYGTKGTFIYDDMGARISFKRDPHKNIKIKKNQKLYNGKACLLPQVFKGISVNKFLNLKIYEKLI